MSFEVSNGIVSEPYSCLLYGTSGVGKTTLASKAEHHIILDCENGSNRVKANRTIIPSLSELRRAFSWVVKEQYVTVVIDSATIIEKWLTQEVLKDNGWPNLAKPGFGQGEKVLCEHWAKFVDGINYLKRNGKNVILIAHSRTKTFQDPMTESYDRYEPEVTNKAISPLCSAVDAVLFLRWQALVRNSEDKDRNIAKPTYKRELYTQESPAFIAKNRFGLEPRIVDPSDNFFDSLR